MDCDTTMAVLGLVLTTTMGCASERAAAIPTPVAPPTLPAVALQLGAEPFWFGLSELSPFGRMPYALLSRRAGDAVVLRVEAPPAAGLPAGAYQQFTLTPDGATGSTLAFETSLTGEVVSGLMPEVARDADLARYCMAPAAGGCDAMTVSFRRVGGSVTFETLRGGAPHHRVSLSTAVP